MFEKWTYYLGKPHAKTDLWVSLTFLVLSAIISAINSTLFMVNQIPVTNRQQFLPICGEWAGVLGDLLFFGFGQMDKIAKREARKRLST